MCRALQRISRASHATLQWRLVDDVWLHSITREPDISFSFHPRRRAAEEIDTVRVYRARHRHPYIQIDLSSPCLVTGTDSPCLKVAQPDALTAGLRSIAAIAASIVRIYHTAVVCISVPILCNKTSARPPPEAGSAAKKKDKTAREPIRSGPCIRIIYLRTMVEKPPKSHPTATACREFLNLLSNPLPRINKYMKTGKQVLINSLNPNNHLPLQALAGFFLSRRKSIVYIQFPVHRLRICPRWLGRA